MKFGSEKIMKMPTDFNLIIIFFDEAFKYGDSAKFYVGTDAGSLCV
jgi:hypothetical protein